MMRSSRFVHNRSVSGASESIIPVDRKSNRDRTAFISRFYFRVQFWIISAADPLLCVLAWFMERFCFAWTFWRKLPELHYKRELKCPPASSGCMWIPVSLEYLWTEKWESAVQVTKLKHTVCRRVSEYHVNVGTCARYLLMETLQYPSFFFHWLVKWIMCSMGNWVSRGW